MKQLIKVFLEFLRYILVGGIAFGVDLFCVWLSKEYILTGLGEGGIYVSIALGFIMGLMVNYWLSMLVVFKQKKSIESFILFAIVGILGLGFTELGMYIGIEIFKGYYLIVKCMVAGLVLMWNYGARKIGIVVHPN